MSRQVERVEATELLDSLLANASIGIGFLDADLRFIRLNSALAEIDGVSVDAHLGRTIEEVLPGIPEECLATLRHVLRTGESIKNREVVGHTPKAPGVLRRWYFNYYPIYSADGSIDGVGVTVSEVTELKRAEEAARESEGRLRLFIQHAPVAIAVFDRQMRYLAASQRWLADYGLSGDVIGKRHYDVFPELPASWREIHRRGLAGEVLKSDEDPLPLSDGTVRWVRWEVLPWHTNTGEIGGIIIFNQDVTQRKRAEEATLDALRLKQIITDNATTGIMMQNAQGLCTFMNPAAEEMTGFTFAEVKGKSVHDTIHYQHADGRPFPISECPIGKAVREMRPIRRHEDVFVRKDGTLFPVMCNASPVQQGGVLTEIVLEFRDITEEKLAQQSLRDAEERFRLLADNIPQLAWMARPDGWIFWYNRRWYEYTGTTLAEMEGWGWQKVHDPQELPRVVEKYRDRIARGELWEDTFPLRRHDGQMRWHLSRAMPLRNGDGQIVLWFGTNTDITDQRNFETSLLEADRRKDEFLATLAHELRNPLAPIRSALELLKVSGTDQQLAAEARTIMERQVKQMVRLIDDLLDVSRITTNKLQLRRERVTLASAVANAIEHARTAIDAKGHKLSVSLPADLIWLDGDPVRLAQIFANILNNAAKYTPDGGQISLVAERRDGEVEVRIKDSGIGIPPTMLSHVFEMFTQIEHSMERSQGGLGVGLSLVKSLVTLHGGAVEAHSEGAGKGSEFIVRLPVVEAFTGGPASSQPAKNAHVASPCRVLVADDNLDAAELVARMLRIRGHTIRIANDGQSAVEIAEKFRPDVAILDIGMPRLNGYQVARWIRQQSWGKGILLVAVTGWGQAEDRRKSREAGFDAHLVKPVDIATVIDLISQRRPVSA